MIGTPAAFKDHWVRKYHDDTIHYLTLHETNESLRMFISLSGLEHAGVSYCNFVAKPIFSELFCKLKAGIVDATQDVKTNELPFDDL